MAQLSYRQALPIALHASREESFFMTETRTETDSFGPLEVQADRYWGAQTQRSLLNFPIGW